MAPKKATIVLNIEKFIRDVEERPAIWNRNFHCNKSFLEQMWDELSTEHKLPKIVLKAKWKGLRDNFRVEYKRIPRNEFGEFLVQPTSFESKWTHYYALIFLTEHMRHRMPKNDSDQSYYVQQQQTQEDCEKTIVEPDLTNGLIRSLQDSDEEFDEDDGEDEEEENDDEITYTPPVAHSQSKAATTSIKTEDAARALFKTTLAGLFKTKSVASTVSTEIDDSNDATKEAQDLTNKSVQQQTETVTTTSICPLIQSVAAVNSAATKQNKIRSVSPPPLYNKAHHSLGSGSSATSTLNKERDDFTINGNACHHHHQLRQTSHEHLTFTQHSYSNGLIPAIKLKRPRLSEDSNFNGSSTMDTSVNSLVPEDDDYHYLLSLHPYMKQLNAAQKLRIRTKIQKLMFKELYKEDIEESK